MWRGDDYAAQTAGRFVPQPYAADDGDGIPVVGAGPQVWGAACPGGSGAPAYPRNRYYDHAVPHTGLGADPTLLGAWYPQIAADGRPVTTWPVSPHQGQPAKRWHRHEPAPALGYTREGFAPAAAPCSGCVRPQDERLETPPCGAEPSWARPFTLLLVVILLVLVAQLLRPTAVPIVLVSALPASGPAAKNNP